MMSRLKTCSKKFCRWSRSKKNFIKNPVMFYRSTNNLIDSSSDSKLSSISIKLGAADDEDEDDH